MVEVVHPTHSGAPNERNTATIQPRDDFPLPRTILATNGPELGPSSYGGLNVTSTLNLENDSIEGGNVVGTSPGNPVAMALDDAAGILLVLRPPDLLLVYIGNGTLYASVPVGSDPSGVAYDQQTGDAWVTNAADNTVSVIHVSNATTVTTLAAGSFPTGVVYDSGTGQVFISDSGNGNMTVFNGSSLQASPLFTDFSEPAGLAYDPAQDEVFVADPAALQVHVVSDVTDGVVASLSLTTSPNVLTFDSATDEVFATGTITEFGPGPGPGNVTAISALNNTVVATISTRSGPSSVAFDNETGDVLVSEPYLDQVAVVSASRALITANLSGFFDPTNVLWASPGASVMVLNAALNAVSVLSDANYSLTGTIGLVASPYGSTFDPTNSDLYITNTFSSSVVVASTKNDSVLSHIPVGQFPIAAVYDNGTGEIFVANLYSNDVSVVTATTNAVLTTIPVGLEPAALAYDEAVGRIFVANYNSSSVSVISDATNSVIATIPVPALPNSVVLDRMNGDVYVAAGGPGFISGAPGNISVISPATDSVVANVTGVGPAPWGLAYDSANGDVYVGANSFSGWTSVTVVSGATNSVVADVGVNNPSSAISYAGSSGDVMVATPDVDEVVAISDATNTFLGQVSVGLEPEGLTSLPNSNLTYVNNLAGGTLSILTAGNSSRPTTYPVTFTESGLPSGYPWEVIIGGTTWLSNSTSLTFPETNGSFEYEVLSGQQLYRPLPGFGYLHLNGTGESEEVSFTLETFEVEFLETGLPAGLTWSANLIGSIESSASDQIDFNVTNGTFGFSDYSQVGLYGGTPANGSVVVSGEAVVESIRFDYREYSITFMETGLPPGSYWNVTGGGKSVGGVLSSLILTARNGSYTYLVQTPLAYSPIYAPQVTISGSDVAVPVAFAALYTVSFGESFLPVNATWSVELNSSSSSSNRSTIIFEETNGSYPFTILHSPGFSPTPESGQVVVDGRNVSVMVDFSPFRAAVTFEEVGLPTGTNWSVTLNGTELASTSPRIAFYEFNGSYSFSFGPVAGFLPSPSYGTIVVLGQSQNVSIGFAPLKGGPPPVPNRGPTVSPEPLAILAGGSILGIALAVVSLWRARTRGGRGPPESSTAVSSPATPAKPSVMPEPHQPTSSEIWNIPK
jgi:YVTN family beta-propeller protein